MKPKEPTAKCKNPPSLANELNQTKTIFNAQQKMQELLKRLGKIEEELEQNL
mgnify:CR=1 FL=1